MPVLSADSAKSDSKPSPQKSSKPIDFGINKLSFEQIEATYKETGFTQKALIHSLTLADLKLWEPSTSAYLQLEMKLNDSPFTLSSRINLFDEIKQVQGKASLTSLNFKPYAKFYRPHLEICKAASL